jgi:hypothetical protein
MALKRTIALSGTHERGGPIVVDDNDNLAVEAFKPGHLLMIVSTGLQKNTANAANVAARFALEREELGSDIDVAYASGDQVKYGDFLTGQRVLAWVPSGEVITKGDYLTTDNAGRLTKTSVAATIRLAQALETMSPLLDTRIRVRIV